jgi:2-polyprenyl-3-methyl-5-hydroxy-6-metoxy-1,4-benzoquinol methylase
VVLKKFYEIMHENYGDSGKSYKEWYPRLKRDFAAKLKILRRFLPKHIEEIRCLDYGCAYGLFLQQLAITGATVYGIDTSVAALSSARETVPDAEGLFCRLTDLRERLGGNNLDCVTMWATIEHLTDPSAVIQQLGVLLGPGGILALDTGVADDYLDAHIKGNVQWFDAPQHLFVFTARGMEQLLEEAGFEVLHADYCYERSWLRRATKKMYLLALSGATRLADRVICMDQRKVPCGHLGLWVARRRATER